MTSLLLRWVMAAQDLPAASILLKVTAITVLGLGAVRLTKSLRASLRHMLLLATFGLAIVIPLVTLFGPAIRVHASSTLIDPAVPSPDPPIRTSVPVPDVAIPPQADGRSSPVMSGLSWLAAVWLIGAAICVSPIVVAMFRVRLLRRSSVPWCEGRTILDAVARRGTQRTRVSLGLCESIAGPITWGVRHPVVLFPADVRTWSRGEVERALIHELEHIRRYDWLTQRVARAVCALYWFHPLMWTAWSRLSLEAERACDDAVIGRADATTYAEQLIRLAERTTTLGQSTLAMLGRHDLATRIRAILDQRQQRGRTGVFTTTLIWLGAASLVVAASPIRLVPTAQSPTPPNARFSVSSVRPCAPGSTRAATTVTPGRITLQCLTLAQIVTRTYVQYGDPPLLNQSITSTDVVSGGPGWSRSDRFTIEAIAENASTVVMMGPMLRALLADRFRLQVHPDSRQVAGYELRVAKRGFKLQPVAADACTPPDPDHFGPTRPVGGEKLPCNGVFGRNGSHSTWTVTGLTLDRVATGLGTHVLGRPVVNKTNIRGQFTFHIEYATEDVNGPTKPGPRAPESSAASDDAPSLFVVFERVLGLALVPARAAQGFLIIDHVEKPSPDAPVDLALPLGHGGAGSGRE